MVGAVSGRAWAPYALMAVLWGIPYLFIKEVVDSFSPAATARCSRRHARSVSRSASRASS